MSPDRFDEAGDPMPIGVRPDIELCTAVCPSDAVDDSYGGCVPLEKQERCADRGAKDPSLSGGIGICEWLWKIALAIENKST